MLRRIIVLLVALLLLLVPACDTGADEEGAEPALETDTELAVGEPAMVEEPEEEAPLVEVEAAAVEEEEIEAEEPEAVLATSPIMLPPEGTDGFPWWNDTVWYEIFVRSFYDSDGDGIGDLQGIIQKLDYLNDGDPETTTDLGITGIWLMPISKSPSYHGYDVVDYYAIDEEYGTEEDFKTLIEAAHERGIRVIVDLVLNHTSSEHPWFVEARAGDSEREEWYVFHEGEQPKQFSPYGGANVWYPAGEDRYYYALFWSEMPDLNYRNPEVTEEMLDASRFWLEEMGADGFRLDAIRFLIEDGRQIENTEETHAWLEEYYDFVKEVEPEAVLVGEVWTDQDKIAPYLDDELDLAFEFNTAEAILSAARFEQASPARLAYAINQSLYPPLQYAPFLTNHDQNRAFDALAGDLNHLKTAASILLTAPGVPFIYYGEEVAMAGSKPDEDIRLPMPWTGEPGAGFTDAGDPWRRFPEGYEERNVAAMDEEPDSLLNHYRRLIHLRNEHEALRIGEYTVLDATANAIYAFIRESDDETLLVVHNLSGEPIDEYALSLEEALVVGDELLTELVSDTEVIAPEAGADSYAPVETLEPYTSYIIQVRP